MQSFFKGRDRSCSIEWRKTLLSILLTQNSMPIIGWFASILGKFMQGLYWFFCLMGVENIGLCIIIFTLVIKLVLFPLTLKQQKFSKLSTLMNPEIQEIQKKYRGKRDNESMMKMQEETQAVYDKYGTSPTGSCLQMAIQMPILFSLYYIVSNIPAYVPQVQDYYKPVSTNICENYDDFEYFDKIVETDKDLKYSYISEFVSDFANTDADGKKTIDVLAKYSTKQWNNMEKTYKNIDNLIDDIQEYDDKDWKRVEKKLTKSQKKGFDDFKERVTDEKSAEKMALMYNKQVDVIDNAKSKIMHINNFGPLNLTQTPAAMKGIAFLIPILSFLTQWYSVRLSMANAQMPDGDNPMASSMKVMNNIMPLFSAFIAYSVPSGLGIYWVANGFFQIIQQLLLNQYFKKVDVNDIIKKNVEKQKKKREKQGNAAQKVINAANMNTKSIYSNNASKNSDKNVTKKGNIKHGSLAEKANMVKTYNEKNK